MLTMDELSVQENGEGWPAGRYGTRRETFRAIESAMISVPPPAAAFLRVIGSEGVPADAGSWNRIRQCLMERSISASARDEIWHLLLRSARYDWPVGAVTSAWMALPGLQKQSRRLWIQLRSRAESEDVDSELVAAFLQRMRSIPISGENVYGRLLGATARDAGDALDVVPLSVRWVPAEPDAVCAPGPTGHPEFVLRRAVLAGVITKDDGELIACTRLSDESLRDQARRRGLTEAAASSRRRRAELVLARSLGALA